MDTDALTRALSACCAVTLLLAGCTSDPEDPRGAPSAPGATAQGSEPNVPELARRLQPSVVTVVLEDGVGSGVVYREDGIVVTNEHVVRGQDQVQVVLADGQHLDGDVLATDEVVDLALVRVDRDDLPVPEFRPELPQVGEFAMVIGSPLGFEGSVTAGIISGLHRDIPDSATRGGQALVDLIQTDASISPGSSGGALVDDQGRVLGLSEAYIPPQAGAVRLGFAIPAQTVVRVAEELLEDGRAVHAYLGVRFGRLTPQIAESLAIDREGALVLSVQPGGPASDAGVMGGDVVVAVDGEAVDSTERVLGVLRQASVGDELELTLVRDGREQEVTVTVRERPQPAASSAPSGGPGG